MGMTMNHHKFHLSACISFFCFVSLKIAGFGLFQVKIITRRKCEEAIHVDYVIDFLPQQLF